jgi:WD40 repeat protein
MPRLARSLALLPLLALACAITVCGGIAMADAVEPVEPAEVSYQREIVPILRAHCQGCHQPARNEGGVDLTSRAGLFAEGDSGVAVITPGQIDASELLAQVTPDETGAAAMPKDGKPLHAEQIALLRRWIAEGAKIDVEHDRPRFDAEHPPTYAKPATITALDVSPDGALIAISGVNETLLLDAAAAARGERVVVRRLIGLASRIESLRFSPDGKQLAVVGGLPGELGELQVWAVDSGELLLSRNATAETLSGVAWSSDGLSLAFGGADTNLRVVKATDGVDLLEQGAHSDWVLDAAFSTDGKFVVSGSRDQTLKLTEAASGRFIDNITNVSPGVPGGPIFAIARHPQRDLVASGGGEGIPRTYMMHRVVERKIGDDSNLVRAYSAMPGRIFAVAFSPDGTRLAAASSDAGHGHVQLFNVPDAFLPPDDVKLIQGKTVDQRSAEEKARIDAYNREGADLVSSAVGDLPPVYALAFSADGKALVTGGADGVVRLFDPADGKLLAAVDAFELTPPNDKPATSDAVASEGASSSAQPPVEFLTDVMPVLGKLGCNAGTCHGSREGQNGFQLSLRGYNPLGDHSALTDDLAARRINLANPEQSLMLLKSIGMVPHGGNAVTEVGSRRYEIMHRWIAEGARYNPDAPRVVSISLAPQNPVVDAEGQTVSMQVLARYTDGSERDVTEDAFIESGELEIASADAAGVVTAIRRGEAPLLARYEGAYAATTLTVMGDRNGFESTPQPVYDEIDALVDAKLARMKIAASGLCTDEEFLRRVHLDLTGLPPTADQVRAFRADASESRAKRAAVIDQLIGSEDFIEHWTNRWADLLLVNGKFLGGEGAAAYRQWIRQAVAENRPYDQFVREIFTATGSNREHPAGSYFKALRTPDLLAETSTQVFLGVRFNCNKCHDHPFEKWTQDNYYGWAAFFADVKLEKDPASGDRTVAGSAVEAAQPLFEMISDAPGGKMLHLRTGQPAPAKFPFEVSTGVSDEERASHTLRQQAAAWIASADNPYFARSYVNRVWAHLLGVGLIEPIDDIRAGNPPTNPELLNLLTDEFVASGFDVRRLIRKICNSRTYQLSHQTNRWNADDARNYSHALPRRLPAEALYDAVHRVVGSTSQLPGVPPGTRAAALPDSMIELESGLLSKLGRPARESGCECERSSELQLGPVMALLNGPTFAAAIDDPNSELAKLEASTPDNGALVDEVFLRVLNRAPSAEERTAAVDMLATPGNEGVAIAAAVAARSAALEPGFEFWQQANRPVEWRVLAPLEVAASMHAELAAQDDGSIVSTGPTGLGTYTLTFEAPLAEIRALRLEALADDRYPARGPGRAPDGNFMLGEFRAFLAEVDAPDNRRRLKIREAEADFSQGGYAVASAIDGKPETGWAVAAEFGRDHAAIFSLSRPIKAKAGTRLVIELDQQFAGGNHLLGKFRLSATDAEPPLLRPAHPAAWRPLIAARELSAAERTKLLDYYLASDGEYRSLKEAEKLLANPRLAAVQDLAWALINSPAFLFNH